MARLCGRVNEFTELERVQLGSGGGRAVKFEDVVRMLNLEEKPD